MYRMAMLTFLLQEEDGLDRIRCMEMALVHDLAESIVGDITPHCGVSKEEKHRLEKEAMDKIQILTGTSGQRLHSLFMEYEDQVTDESHFVKELDLFDMTMQAFEYEKRDETPGSLQEFIDATKGKFKHPLLVSLVQRLYSERDGLLKGVPLCPG
ncbi:hypothetical protein AAG570_002286 [Ranatra chinensis]|uniref:5'-deoxynucleotidase HDDC2 n=1 Tax=Ranatra chinensis TaxID=642074 RepID=A0ABD0Y949_9HEMI